MLLVTVGKKEDTGKDRIALKTKTRESWGNAFLKSNERCIREGILTFQLRVPLTVQSGSTQRLLLLSKKTDGD